MNIPIPRVLGELFGSKKFLASLAAILVIVLDRSLGWQISDEKMIAFLGIVATYVVGQGIADAGKEAVKLRNGSEAQK